MSYTLLLLVTTLTLRSRRSPLHEGSKPEGRALLRDESGGKEEMELDGGCRHCARYQKPRTSLELVG